MNFIKVKKDEPLAFHGITIDREYVDNDLKSITVKFEDGNFFRVVGKWDSCEVQVKEPPKFITKYRAVGEYRGSSVNLEFDCIHKAQDAVNDFVGANLTIENFEVEV